MDIARPDPLTGPMLFNDWLRYEDVACTCGVPEEANHSHFCGISPIFAAVSKDVGTVYHITAPILDAWLNACVQPVPRMGY